MAFRHELWGNMASTIVTAVTCGRCGAPVDANAAHCTRCGARNPGQTDVARMLPLMHGTTPASAVRRLCALLVDAGVPLVLVAVACVPGLPTPTRVLLIVLALAAAGLGLVLIGRSGQGLGGRLMRTRTVDALSATPLGTRGLLRRIATGAGRGLSSVDLRIGRDPLGPVFAPAATPPPAPSPASSAVPAPVVRAAPAAQPEAAGRAGAVAPAAPPAPLTLRLENGQRISLVSSLLVGRNPANGAGGVQHELLALPDLSRTLSKTHALIEWEERTVWVTDLGSTNGTALVDTTDIGAVLDDPFLARTEVPVGVRTAVPHTSSIALGDRYLSWMQPQQGEG